MGGFLLSAGRGVGVACFALALLFSGTLAAAQDYDAMMPEQLRQEVHKLEVDYREVMNSVNAAQTERLAKKAAGAAEDELRALDAKVGQLVTKAEKLKVDLDYLRELYQTKRHEYKTR